MTPFAEIPLLLFLSTTFTLFVMCRCFLSAIFGEDIDAPDDRDPEAYKHWLDSTDKTEAYHPASSI